MRIRWTIGAVFAALAVTLVLPGIASADHHVDVNASTVCDGTFAIDADYFGSGVSSQVFIDYNGNNYDDGLDQGVDGDGGDIPSDMTATRDNSHYVASGGPDYFAFNADEDVEDFFTLSGTFDSADNAGGVTIAASVVNVAGVGDTETVTAGADADDNPDNDWEKCVIDYCVQGDSDGATDYSFQATPESNCDPTRVCADDESLTVSEFDAEQLLEDGATKGSCTPAETATAPTEPPFLEREPITEFVDEDLTESEVAEVSPAIDVAALPSAGYSGDGDISYGWVAIFAVTLVGLGGATALMARPRK